MKRFLTIGVLLSAVLALSVSVLAQDEAPILDADARYVDVGGVSIYLIERGAPDGLPVFFAAWVRWIGLYVALHHRPAGRGGVSRDRVRPPAVWLGR